MTPEAFKAHAERMACGLVSTREGVAAALVSAYQAGLNRHGETFGDMCDSVRAEAFAKGKAAGAQEGEKHGYDMGWSECQHEEEYRRHELVKIVAERDARIGLLERELKDAERRYNDLRAKILRLAQNDC